MKGLSYFSESLGTGVNLNVQLLVNTQNLRTHMCLEGMPDFVSLKGFWWIPLDSFFKFPWFFLLGTWRNYLFGYSHSICAHTWWSKAGRENAFDCFRFILNIWSLSDDPLNFFWLCGGRRPGTWSNYLGRWLNWFFFCFCVVVEGRAWKEVENWFRQYWVFGFSGNKVMTHFW